MRRRAKWRSGAGLLLVEAVLAAVAIAVGLVAVSRGLSGQLQALRSLEAREAALAAAGGTLLEWESRGLADRPLPAEAAGNVAGAAGTSWSVRAAPTAMDATGVAASVVALTVTRSGPPRAAARLAPAWPLSWIPSSWR